MTNRHLKKSESTLPLTSISFFESSKVTPIPNKDRYRELTQFRQLVKDEGVNSLYSFEKHQKTARLYRNIFFGFTLLFFTLMLLIFFQKTTVFYSLFFGNSWMTKMILITLCGSVALLSMFMSTKIRAEKEAIQYLFRQTKNRLKRIYAIKCARIGWKRFLVYLHIHPQATAVIEAYYEAADNVHEAKEAAFSLIEQILNRGELEILQKKSLVNQVIEELKDKLNSIIHTFRKM